VLIGGGWQGRGDPVRGGIETIPENFIGNLRLARWTIPALAQARVAARKAKNWAEADRLRGALHAAGWEMEDRADGYALKPRPQSN